MLLFIAYLFIGVDRIGALGITSPSFNRRFFISILRNVCIHGKTQSTPKASRDK